MEGHEWDEEQVKSAKKPNYSKLYVVKPALLSLIGEVKGKTVLELGCGTGYWLNTLADMGAHCVGVDVSENQIEEAKANNPHEIQYLVADASGTMELPNERFDIIFLEHVLLEISDISKVQDIFHESHRLLKENGYLIVSDLHPLAPETGFSNIVVSEDYTYFNSGFPFQIVSHNPDGTQTKYTDFHWTFADLVNSVTGAGFKVTKVLEPTPGPDVIKKRPYLAYRKDKPLSLMIKAQKTRGT